MSMGRGAWHGSVGPVRYCPAYPEPQQLFRSEPFPGQHFPHHPVDLRPRDPGHLFPPKPVAGSAEKLRPAGTGPHGDASQPRCGVLVQPHVAFLRLELRFYTPTGSSHVCQGLQRGILRCIGQIVAGFAAVIPAVNGQWISPGLRLLVGRTLWALNR